MSCQSHPVDCQATSRSRAWPGRIQQNIPCFGCFSFLPVCILRYTDSELGCFLSAQIVFTTLSSSGLNYFAQSKGFDTLIVDEACQVQLTCTSAHLRTPYAADTCAASHARLHFVCVGTFLALSVWGRFSLCLCGDVSRSVCVGTFVGAKSCAVDNSVAAATRKVVCVRCGPYKSSQCTCECSTDVGVRMHAFASKTARASSDTHAPTCMRLFREELGTLYLPALV
jgi:hypothetical protein